MADIKVVGKALYLEMRSGGNTMQLILTPEGFNSNNKLVPMTLYRRRINRITPRKTWKPITSHLSPECDAMGKLVQYSVEVALPKSKDKMSFLDPVLNQLVANGYTVYKQPIAVEVTSEDLDDVRLSKTPYKIIARITRSRRATGFEEALFTS